MRTKLYLDGEKSQAICSHCAAMVTTTFVRRDVPFTNGRAVARGILVAVCDVCDAIVATPAQSTPAIRDARQREIKSIEAQLPAIYLDALDLAAFTLDPESSIEFRKVLLTVYVHRFASGEYRILDLLSAHEEAQSRYEEYRGGLRRRLSMKVTPRLAQNLKTLSQSTEMSHTDVLKSIIFRIQADILQARRPALLRELACLAHFA